MNNSIFEIFKIDKLRSTNFARILFLVLVLLNLTTVFFPLGDNDFSAFSGWYDKLYDAANKNDFDTFDDLMHHLPFTHDNYIFLLHAFIASLLTMIGGLLYTGLFIRDYRIATGKGETAISMAKLVFRIIILVLGTFLLATPLLIVSVLLFFVVIFIVPCAIMFRACYLSGDSGFFMSFRSIFTVTRGYYLINSKNIFLLILTGFVFDVIIELVGKISSTAEYVLDSYLMVLLTLATARYIGIIYCRMIDHPRAFVASESADK